jgi:DNA-binding transcriptional ArsR family regulator
MSEEDQISLLRKMQHTLDDIKAILVLSNQDRLGEAKKELLKEGSVKQQIYELCDGTRTLQDIAAAIQKSTDYVSSYLSILRREGLIRTVEREGRQVHEQIF